MLKTRGFPSSEAPPEEVHILTPCSWRRLAVLCLAVFGGGLGAPPASGSPADDAPEPVGERSSHTRADEILLAIPANARNGLRGMPVDEPAPLLLAQASPAPSDVPAEPATLPPPRFEIRRFRVSGNTLLAEGEIEALLHPYTGADKDFADVQHALEALQQAYQSVGYTAVQVLLPEQELEAGEVQFTVIEAQVGRVEIEGNKFFSDANIRASVPGLAEGVSPNAEKIAESLRLANENPSKQTNVLLRTGESENQVDATIKVTDEAPWKLVLGLDNTGTPETGRRRATVAFQHSNVSGHDDVLTMQYVTSPQESKTDDVFIFGAGYKIPLYEYGDSVLLFAGYSDVNSGTVQGLFNVSGAGTVAGARYNYNLRKRGDYEHGLIGSLDYRYYNNNVTQPGNSTPLVPDVRVHPVGITYAGNWSKPGIQASFYIGEYANIVGGSRGEDDDFRAERVGADANYTLTKLGASYSRAVVYDWQVRVDMSGQYTTEPLVSGEQFGIGGIDSVRGFFEREVANDYGYRMSFELYTPDIGPAFGGSGLRARLLAFYDRGQVKRNLPQPGDIDTESIASSGVGLRMNYGKAFSLRMDFARVLEAGGVQGEHDEMLHFGLTYLF